MIIGCPPPVGLSDNNFIKPQLPPKPQFLPKTKPQLPPKPIIDNFARPLTKIIDDEKNTIQIIPKKKEVGLNETNLSEQLSKVFPNINEVNKQDEEKFKEDVIYLMEILTRIGEDDTPLEFEFFTGGKNKKNFYINRDIGPSSNNLDFLDFLQSNQCKQVLVNNKVKIHIETGNIYYDHQDTNESILDFFFNQQNPITGVINSDFVYGESYADYFNWLIKGFDS